MNAREIIDREAQKPVPTVQELERRIEMLIQIVEVISDRMHEIDGRVYCYKATPPEGNVVTSLKLP